MDYKYILQLLDRFWKAETTLEEEDILHIFFSQSSIPEELEPYRPYFGYARQQKQECRLGDEFDRRVLAKIGQEQPRQSRAAQTKARLMPLFRAVAIVAIVLTLSNIAQMPYSAREAAPTAGQTAPAGMATAAAADTLTTDSLTQSQAATVLKPQATEPTAAE